MGSWGGWGWDWILVAVGIGSYVLCVLLGFAGDDLVVCFAGDFRVEGIMVWLAERG